MNLILNEVRARELFYNSKGRKNSQCHYETFLNKGKENNTDTTFKKLVALESTIALLKQNKLTENPECFVEAHVIFEIYNSCLTNASSPQEMQYNAFRGK